MSDADLLALLTLAVCLVGSMFFSGTETAIASFGDHQWRKLVDEGGPKAKIARPWVETPVRVLSTVLVGNNIVNTLIGSVSTAQTTLPVATIVRRPTLNVTRSRSPRWTSMPTASRMRWCSPRGSAPRPSTRTWCCGTTAPVVCVW